MDLALRDRVVVVTGATGGIGGAICKAFLQEGSIVVPIYRSSREKLRPLFEWAGDQGISEESLFPVEVELSDSASCRNGVAAIAERFGTIDVLVNCAGQALELPFMLTEEEQWEEVMAVNLTSVARFTRLVVKQMYRAKSGAVVNVSSVLGLRFGRGTVAYAVSKAGVVRFSQALALEVGPKGIRVNTVCPGVIGTSMSQNLTRRLDEKLQEMTALRRVGTPEEVSHTVVFLSSEKTASYITGATVVIDGGISI
ncbi:MAG: SDR family oxidoreductase [Gemmatimonadetes bacterium]|nr:SDR family oxidoreductase [Gemmatimonadota bacterium]